MKSIIKKLADIEIESLTDEEANEVFTVAEKLGTYKCNSLSQVTNPREYARFLRAKYANWDHEVFGVSYLDTQSRVVATDAWEGTIEHGATYPREVFKRCLELKAVSVILFHNHPSGCVHPSEADIQSTKYMAQALQYIDVDVLDHTILGHEGYYSMGENGDFIPPHMQHKLASLETALRHVLGAKA